MLSVEVIVSRPFRPRREDTLTERSLFRWTESSHSHGLRVTVLVSFLFHSLLGRSRENKSQMTYYWILYYTRGKYIYTYFSLYLLVRCSLTLDIWNFFKKNPALNVVVIKWFRNTTIWFLKMQLFLAFIIYFYSQQFFFFSFQG